MNNKYFILLALLLVALAQCAFAQGSVQILVPDDTTGYTKPVSAGNPLPVDADVNIGSITVEVFPVFADSTGANATATVDASNRAVVNIGSETIGLIDAINAIVTACASETNLVTAINAVEAELSDAHAAADAAATHTLAVMSYLSDNTNIVPWFTAVILGDNVNGNNQAAVAPWIFDGTTWYRRRSVPSTGIALSAEASPTVWEQQTITLVANTAQTITSEITGTRKNMLLKAQEEKPFWVSIDGDAVIGTNGTLVNDWILLDVPLAVNVSVIASEAFAVSVIESGW